MGSREVYDWMLPECTFCHPPLACGRFQMMKHGELARHPPLRKEAAAIYAVSLPINVIFDRLSV
jgi:hypothetical protein